MDQVKITSEANLRYIIKILIGMMDTQSEIAQQCVLPYVSDGSKVYQSPMLCVYNDGTTYGLYMCKYTTSGAWNANSWIEICSVSTSELSAADIDNYMSSVSSTTWDYFKNIINDDAVSTTKVWSSSKTYEELQSTYGDAVAYTVKYVNKAKLITYKKVSSTADVTDDDVLYLVPDSAGNYAIYVLDTTTGSPLKLSDTSISLDDYYTKTEVDSTFLKQTDATLKYKDINSYGAEQGALSFTNGKTTVTDAINENTRLNSVTDAKFSGKQDTLTWDTNPVSGSTNPVTSDGIYTAIANTDKNVGHIGAFKRASGTTTDATYTTTGGSWQNLCSFTVDEPGYYFCEVVAYYYSHDVSTNDCSKNFSLRFDTSDGALDLSNCEPEKISSCLSSGSYNIGHSQSIIYIPSGGMVNGDMYCPGAAGSTTGIAMHVGYSAVKIG